LKKGDRLPRRDTKGIVDPAQLMTRVRFRRVDPAPALRAFVEHYWLIDWNLPAPYEQHVVPHPSVNIVFQPGSAQVAGVGRELFSIKLEGTSTVSGIQFRPGGFRPFFGRPVATLTGRRVPLPFRGPTGDVLHGNNSARAAALDRFLIALDPRPDAKAAQAMRLVDAIRHDRTILRVEGFAAQAGLTERALQRLFADCVGVGPKWVILRYRVLEVLDRAEPGVAWATLAADLGYSDQAHLIRDFSATLGMTPTDYLRLIHT
jgi:AraC-like DNA-binding protein